MKLPENMTLQGTLESDRERHQKQSYLVELFAWASRISLLLAVIISPWLIASVSHWAQFWISVALLAGLGFWWFETALNRRQSQIFPYVLIPVAIGVAIGLIQLIPLGDGLSGILSGRQGEIYERYSVDANVLSQLQENGSNATKRISLDQEGTWQQLYMLMIGIAGLLLGCRLFRTRRDILLLLGLITLNGVAITFLGWLQQLTDDGTRLFWSIELTQGGAPFGPFVNRNNAAGYLLMCLASAIALAGMLIEQRKTVGPHQMVSKEIPFWRQFYLHVIYFISDLTATKLAAILALIFISTGILSTLSRGGVVAMLVGAIIAFLFYGIARKPKKSGVLLLPIFLLVLALSTWIGFGDQLIDRLESLGTASIVDDEGRLKTWTDTMPATREMGLFGAGLGSYHSVHRMYRQDREQKIYRYAENQYFQSLVEAGWPGLILFLIAIGISGACVMLLLYRGSSTISVSLGVAGVFLLASGCVAAFFDFGLYIPSNTLLMAVLIGLLSYHAHSLAGRLKMETWLRFQTKNVVVQVVLLCVFAGVSMAALDLGRQARLDAAMKYKISKCNYKTLDMEKTNASIKEVSELVRNSKSVPGLNYLANLCIHRARLQYFEQLFDERRTKLLDPEERAKSVAKTWRTTNLNRMQESLYYLKKNVSEYEAAKFLQHDLVTQNLPAALGYFQMSRRISPLQPQVQYKLGKLNALIGTHQSAVEDIEKSVELAPTNAEMRLGAGLFYLQSNSVDESTKHFRKYLELAPRDFNIIMQLLTGRTNRLITPVKDEVICDWIIPDNPDMLYRFANNFMDEQSRFRSEVFKKADLIMGEASRSKRSDVLLSGYIKLARGETEAGIEQLEFAMISDPGDQKTRIRLVNLYHEQGMLEKAKQNAEYLLRINRKSAQFQKMVQDVEEAIRIREKQTQTN